MTRPGFRWFVAVGAAVAAFVVSCTPSPGGGDPPAAITCPAGSICGWVSGAGEAPEVGIYEYPKTLDAGAGSFDKSLVARTTVGADGYFEVRLGDGVQATGQQRAISGGETLQELVIRGADRGSVLVLSESGQHALTHNGVARSARFNLSAQQLTDPFGSPLPDPPVQSEDGNWVDWLGDALWTGQSCLDALLEADIDRIDVPVAEIYNFEGVDTKFTWSTGSSFEVSVGVDLSVPGASIGASSRERLDVSAESSAVVVSASDGATHRRYMVAVQLSRYLRSCISSVGPFATTSEPTEVVKADAYKGGEHWETFPAYAHDFSSVDEHNCWEPEQAGSSKTLSSGSSGVFATSASIGAGGATLTFGSQSEYSESSKYEWGPIPNGLRLCGSLADPLEPESGILYRVPNTWFADGPPRVTTGALPTGHVGSPYFATLTANTDVVSWQPGIGGLPDGLSLEPATGEISGVPVSEGLTGFNIVATTNEHLHLVASLALQVDAAPAVHGSTRLVSVASDGSQADADSASPTMSGDARYVAFMSDASNLVGDDTNGTVDVFLWDRNTGNTQRVSIASDGSQANARSFSPGISSDGRYVTFGSAAKNLVPDDTSDFHQAFVWDSDTGSTQRVAVAHDGNQANGFSSDPRPSGDGRYVTFVSGATNLVPGDTNGFHDVFVLDRDTGTTERVSVASEGTGANGGSFKPEISDDGRFVTYVSDASNLVPGDTNGSQDVFIWDRNTGTTERVSISSDGAEADFFSDDPQISSDGRYVTYWSRATNLVPDDTNDSYDVFVRDRNTGTTERVSVASDGTQGDRFSQEPAISSDGRYVTYWSGATNLVHGDTNGFYDVFVRDRSSGSTERVSIASDGTQANRSTATPQVSDDGRYVTYQSSATNLVPGGTSSDGHIFLWDRGT